MAERLGLVEKLELSLTVFFPLFCILKSISISCVNFCDCSNRLKKASANYLIESKVKLTSLGVEADGTAAIAIVDGFGGSVNVGILKSFLNTPC